MFIQSFIISIQFKISESIKTISSINRAKVSFPVVAIPVLEINLLGSLKGQVVVDQVLIMGVGKVEVDMQETLGGQVEDEVLSTMDIRQAEDKKFSKYNETWLKTSKNC